MRAEGLVIRRMNGGFLVGDSGLSAYISQWTPQWDLPFLGLEGRRLAPQVDGSLLCKRGKGIVLGHKLKNVYSGIWQVSQVDVREKMKWKSYIYNWRRSTCVSKEKVSFQL